MRAAGLTVVSVPRVAAGDMAALRRVVALRRGPVVASGVIDGWPARTLWNPDELRRRHGGRRVSALMDLPGSGVLFPREQESYERELSFGAFVDAMLSAQASAPCYLAYRRAHEIFDPADYDFSSLVPAVPHPTDTRVWIGSAGTRSMLHSDLKDNLFCQIWGEKDVTLLEWKNSRAAYPFPDNLVNSQVDLGNPDLRRFPRLRHVSLLHVCMAPGDVLYIPRGCWHDIRSRTPSVSLNHWFGEPLGLAQYLRLLAVLGPGYWASTARDFVVHGLLRRQESTRFFFSPASTGKRLYDALRSGNFSRDNDPSAT
jgi:lysine-specific demethylase 8